jgi:hypothetical protein
MFGIISHILTAFGLASASGLNAYIPLLTVALAARFTSLVKLNPPFDILTNEWVIGALVVLLAIETVVDKIPAVDTINDIFQTLVRPSAGALLFAASTNAANLHPVVAAILGLVLAFGVHSVKATARPVVTAGTAGIGNPVVSVAEDIASLAISLLAILAPVAAVLVFLVLFFLIIRRLGSRRRSMTTIRS